MELGIGFRPERAVGLDDGRFKKRGFVPRGLVEQDLVGFWSLENTFWEKA